jgi:hypothetical protein
MKTLKTAAFRISREVANFVNSAEIAREDIVSILYNNDQFIIFYYG